MPITSNRVAISHARRNVMPVKNRLAAPMTASVQAWR